MRHPFGLSAAVLLAVIALTSCSGGTASSTASTPALSLLPSADAFISSVVATRAMGTAHLTVAVTTTAPSRTDRSNGTGPAVISSGWGDLTWSSTRATYRELVNNRGVYVQSDPPAGAWEHRPVDAPTLTSGYVDVLRDLGILRDVVNQGTDEKARTTRYTGWLPLDEDGAALLGLAPSDVATFPADQSREEVTAWLDDFGHIVRVDRRVANRSADLVRSTTTLDDFSLLLDLSSPTDVTSTTDLQ